jgi:hypothetical protein
VFGRKGMKGSVRSLKALARLSINLFCFLVGTRRKAHCRTPSDSFRLIPNSAVGIRPEYERLLADYLYKRDLIADLVLELTRFSNAICDEIRAEIDAQFRFEEGTLMVMYGPSVGFEYEYLRPVFRPEDYRGRSHPYPGLESFQTERHTRDRAIGERGDDGSAL